MCLAVPGRIETIQGSGLDAKARVDFGGIHREVSLACVPEAVVGDYVMVHVGLALSVVDAEEARLVFEDLRELRLLTAELEA